MGIKGLAKLLSQEANGSIKEKELKNYMGRTVAIDASMWLYQFLIAVRQEGAYQMTDSSGEVTSHIIGLFYRTIRLLENGLKPVFVFDGKPPDMKSGELKKRKEAREKAKAELEEAAKNDDKERAMKMERRLVRVGKEHNDDAKKLLRLMGIPVVEAPCEAEATAARLCAAGLVWAVGTEDMDALTFGTTRLLRGLHHPKSRKQPVKEFNLPRALAQMDITMDQFIDICILCGCDYTSTIRGVGPKGAVNGIREHGSIEKMIEHIKGAKKYTIPEDFNYVGSREMFKNPEVLDSTDLKLTWKKPDKQGLIDYLCTQKGFALERVEKGVERMVKAKGKSGQKRLDSFFKPKPMSFNNMKKKNKPQTKKRKGSTLKGNTKRRKL